MIILCYLKDGDRYRLWVPTWQHGNFLMISREDFLAISRITNVFALVDQEDRFMSEEQEGE